MLIVPGYIVGLCCLLIITYRTMIAFFSDSKAVVVHINRYGEQFLDIFALLIIWIICIFGLIVIFVILRKEKQEKKSNYDFDEQPLIAQKSSFLNKNDNIDFKIDKQETIGFIAKSSQDFDEEFIFKD